MELNLQKPLLFFDIESTGLDIPVNSIIELSFVKVFPGGEERIKTWKIKPWDYERGCQRPIEPAASEVNGVTDDMLTGGNRLLDSRQRPGGLQLPEVRPPHAGGGIRAGQARRQGRRS